MTMMASIISVIGWSSKKFSVVRFALRKSSTTSTIGEQIIGVKTWSYYKAMGSTSGFIADG